MKMRQNDYSLSCEFLITVVSHSIHVHVEGYMMLDNACVGSDCGFG